MSINISSEIVHFAGHIAGSPAPAAVPIVPRGLSCIEYSPAQRVQRPGTCAPCLLHGLRLHLVRPALLPVLCSLSGCAGGLGVSTGGAYSRRPAPPGQSRHRRKNKKGSKKHPHPYCQSQNFPKKQKDPYKGSVFCAILVLQALKGRNLQWLKVE